MGQISKFEPSVRPHTRVREQSYWLKSAQKASKASSSICCKSLELSHSLGKHRIRGFLSRLNFHGTDKDLTKQNTGLTFRLQLLCIFLQLSQDCQGHPQCQTPQSESFMIGSISECDARITVHHSAVARRSVILHDFAKCC